MSQSGFALSARTYLIAGVSAAVVGTAVVNPVSAPAVNPAKSAAAAVALSSITTPLENAIKNTYDFVEPWVAWGFELTQYALSFIPGVWWLAPGIDLAYFTIEPLVQSGVYAFADVVGLNFGQIWPDITAGVSQSINNAINYGLAWLGSLVPLPPFPPFPPRPFAASSAGSVLPAAATGLLAAPKANSITTPIEVAIKNSYDFVQGWTNYAAQWADNLVSLVPVLNWFAPAIPLVYNTIEPLVRGGVYSFADLIGFNWRAIGPDVWNGFSTSINNAIQGILNWINYRPLSAAAVTANSVGLRAAAAAKPVAAAPETAVEVGAGAASEAETPATAVTDNSGPKADTPKVAEAPEAPEAPATEADEPAKPVAEAPTVVEAPAVAETPAAVEAPAAAETPQPARTARRGDSAKVAADSGSTVKAERSNRAPRSHSRGN